MANSLTPSLPPSPPHPLINSLTPSVIPWVPPSPLRPLTDSLIPWPPSCCTPSPPHPLTPFLLHSLSPSLTPVPMHALSPSVTHSLPPSRANDHESELSRGLPWIRGVCRCIFLPHKCAIMIATAQGEPKLSPKGTQTWAPLGFLLGSSWAPLLPSKSWTICMALSCWRVISIRSAMLARWENEVGKDKYKRGRHLEMHRTQ